MSRHEFPPTPAEQFPTPPRTVEDDEGRAIRVRAAPDPDDEAAVDGDGETTAAGDDPERGDLASDDPDPDDPEVEVPEDFRDVREAAARMYEAFDPSDRAQGVPPAGGQRIRTWLDDLLAEGINVLAWHGEDVVGHAVLMPDADGGWELAIFVHQSYQSAGIGTELLRTLLGYGRERGVERIWLTVERWNRAAIALYESVGFERSDAERFEMGMSMRLADEAD